MTSLGMNGSCIAAANKPLLAAVEVVHERGIHAGGRGDRPDRGAVVAVLGELRAGGGEDRLAGAAVSGAAAGARARVLAAAVRTLPPAARAAAGAGLAASRRHPRPGGRQREIEEPLLQRRGRLVHAVAMRPPSCPAPWPAERRSTCLTSVRAGARHAQRPAGQRDRQPGALKLAECGAPVRRLDDRHLSGADDLRGRSGRHHLHRPP